MEALIIGPVISEFGWELMEWQGYCRAKAEGILKGNVLVCTTVGRQYLYEDFADLFVTHNIRCDRDGHKPRHGKIYNPPELERVRRILTDWSKQLRFRGYNVGRLQSWGPVAHIPKHIENQKFIRYGHTPVDKANEFKMVVHARNVAVGGPCSGDNYPRQLWDGLLTELFDSKLVQPGEVAAIGTHDAAFCPDGCVDRIDYDLSIVADMMHHAKLVIGPSSGPMHLASLCGTPHVVWATGMYQSLMPKGNEYRYKTQWNPFNTPVDVLLHKKGQMIPPEKIAEVVIRRLEEL